MISIIDSARFQIDRIFVKEVVQRFLRSKGVSEITNLNIIFVGKRKMLYIATVYKREPEALPVLSFSYRTDKRMMNRPNDEITKQAEDELNLLGEVFICYPQAVLLAAERNKKVDFTLTMLLEHGITNLLNE